MRIGVARAVSMWALVQAGAGTEAVHRAPRAHEMAVGSESELWAGLSASGDDVGSPLIPSAEEVAAAQDAWSRRVLGADTNEQDALHQRLRAARRPLSARRNLQVDSDDVWAGMWKFDSSVLTGSMVGNMGSPSLPGEDERWLSLPSGSDGDAAAQAMLRASRVEDQSVCEDPLAENVGDVGTCSYDCGALGQHFFPESERTRCFLNTGGWPSELMDMRRDRLDWHTCASNLMHCHTEFQPPCIGVASLPPRSFEVLNLGHRECAFLQQISHPRHSLQRR